MRGDAFIPPSGRRDVPASRPGTRKESTEPNAFLATRFAAGAALTMLRLNFLAVLAIIVIVIDLTVRWRVFR